MNKFDGNTDDKITMDQINFYITQDVSEPLEIRK